jgi:SAM-dependent methyltransferase
MPDSRDRFHSDLYIRHNARRLEHLAALHLDLTGKSVLELGAGIGDHSIFFLDRACRVTALEPRAENVDVIRARTREAPRAWDPARLRVVHGGIDDLDRLEGARTYDIVHCYGLLYHLPDPHAALEAAATRCHGLLLVETKVRLPHQPASIEEDRENVTNAIDGAARILTRDELLGAMARLFPHVYEPTIPVAHEQFPPDWNAPPAAQWPIRAVAIGARAPVASPFVRAHHA